MRSLRLLCALCGSNKLFRHLLSKIFYFYLPVEINLSQTKSIVMRLAILFLIIPVLASCGFRLPHPAADRPVQEIDSILDPVMAAKLSLTNATQYRQVLSRLDPGDLASLEAAGTLLKSCVADTLTRDSIFVVFDDFFTRAAEGYLENNEEVNIQLGDAPSLETVNLWRSKFAACGIQLKSVEGTFSLEPRTGYLLDNFGPALSVAYRAYLTILSREQQARFAGMAALPIPPDSLASHIIAWEHFMERFPRFISLRMARDHYARSLGTFLTGVGQSTVFDPETNLLNDSSKMAFETFVLKNPESKSAAVVNGYLRLLQSADFSYTAQIDSFLLENVFAEEEAAENK